MWNLLNAGLEFSWMTIGLHILNLAVLVAGLWLLLYKPVKKMVAKRKETIQKQLDDNTAAKEEVEGMKEQYGKLIADVSRESAKVSEEARIAAEEQKAHILEQAGREGADMIARAKQEIEKEKARAEVQIRETVADLAADMAGKIIQREIKPADNKRIIDDCLKKWGSDENR